MPELPFLQVLAENVDAQVRGRTVTGVRLSSVSLLKSFDPPLSALEGRRLSGARRIAKLIVLDAQDLSLVLHLMRDGRVQIGAPRTRPGKDLALGLRFESGQELRVVERGPKKRASAYVVPTDELAGREPAAGLGLDPFAPELTAGRLHEMLQGATVQLKRFLTLQRYITGIGNAYSDEILWEGRFSPFLSAKRLGLGESAALLDAVRRALTRALEQHRAHFGETLPTREPVELLRVHRHAGEPCPRCGTRIAEVAYAEKETYYCPSCQTGGKVYADRRMSRLLK
ncbi:MAG TPA: DNA-formamidopyrimidine glycosylase family protein [bacterium]|nr:DNA-formamidopyrimidine glycosylase family protein [bacterium]